MATGKDQIGTFGDSVHSRIDLHHYAQFNWVFSDRRRVVRAGEGQHKMARGVGSLVRGAGVVASVYRKMITEPGRSAYFMYLDPEYQDGETQRSPGCRPDKRELMRPILAAAPMRTRPRQRQPDRQRPVVDLASHGVR